MNLQKTPEQKGYKKCKMTVVLKGGIRVSGDFYYKKLSRVSDYIENTKTIKIKNALIRNQPNTESETCFFIQINKDDVSFYLYEQ